MPLKSQLHVNQLLSNVSVQYKNSEYIWDKLFPQVTVKKDTDYYRVYDRNFRVPETARAPKALAREFGFEFSLSTYALEQHALKDYVGVDEVENNDQGSLEVDTTESLTDAIYRRMELAAANLFTTTNWSLNVSLAAGSPWSSNTITTDPIPVFDTGATSIINASGKTPNFVVLPRDGYVAMKNHVSVLDRVKYTSDKVTEAMLAGLIGVPQLLVPTAVQDTNAEGLGVSTTPFFQDFAFMGWKPSSPGLRTPSVGYTFLNSTPRVRSWFDQERNATAIEVEVKFTHKVVASLCGYMIKNTV